MNIHELCQELREDYTLEKGCGISKIQNPGYENVYFVVPPPPPIKINVDKLPHQLISETLRTLAALPQINQMSELDKMVQYLFVRREVVQSSRLEGTWSTIDHALTPGELVDTNEGKNEHKAVRSYASVIEEIVNEAIVKKESVFTKDLICHIQKQIVVNDPKSKGMPGQLRTEGKVGSIVTIGGGSRIEHSIYNPAPAIHVMPCLDLVLKWLRDVEIAQKGDVGLGLSLPVRIAIIHSHFEAIHPFTDGNGRTGRALWPLQMICSGYMPLYLSGYVEMYKDDYGKSLGEAQKKLNYIPLIEFICKAIIESERETRKTKEALNLLEVRWNNDTRFREKSAPKRALKVLLKYPIITSSLLETELQIKRTAADDAIKALIKNKIIRYRSVENRHRVYAAEEVIQILSRPFGEEIEISLEKAKLLLEQEI